MIQYIKVKDNKSNKCYNLKLDGMTFAVKATKPAESFLILTDSYYSMSDIYPGKFSTMTEIPDNLDTSKVTNMNCMFIRCFSLTSIPDLDTSNVTRMDNMFNECYNLTFVPQLDTSKVSKMSYMFDYCTSLTSIPWPIDCTSITSTAEKTSLYHMFHKTGVTQVTLKNVAESLKSGITSQYLKGDDTLTIEFV